MKTRSLILGFVVALSASHTDATDIYTAHEWGTFTTISGSDGVALPWWTPSLEGPAVLPEFIRPVLSFSKVGEPSLMRMETPVIYFYAMAPMSVEVGVSYPNGRLTDVFPAGAPQLPGGNLMPGASVPLYSWKLDLLPPTLINAAVIPPVNGRGAHYQHAREVPEAWIVRGQSPLDKNAPETRETEKFVFYRGTGGGQLPLNVSLAGDGTATFASWSVIKSDVYLVRVRNGITRWQSAKVNVGQSSIGTRHSLKIDEAAGSQDADALAAALKQSLASAGLTASEAAAMVATWTDAWLHEEGTRVLYLLPRAWIDTALPLTMKPAPARLERVFVARAELFDPRQEQELAKVFSQSATDEVLARGIAGLRLGRFTPAALERAVRLNEASLREAYARVTAIARKQNPAQ